MVGTKLLHFQHYLLKDGTNSDHHDPDGRSGTGGGSRADRVGFQRALLRPSGGPGRVLEGSPAFGRTGSGFIWPGSE